MSNKSAHSAKVARETGELVEAKRQLYHTAQEHYWNYRTSANRRARDTAYGEYIAATRELQRVIEAGR